MTDHQHRRSMWLMSGSLLLTPSVLLLALPMIGEVLEVDGLSVAKSSWWPASAVALATFGLAGAIELRWRRAPGVGLLAWTAAGLALSAYASLWLSQFCGGGPIK